METKKVKKRRLNIARTLVFILFIYIIVCFVVFLYKEPVKHYEISGNNYLKDVDILRDLGIEDYPSYVSINTKTLEKKLEKNPLIKNAKVKYGFNFQIHIEIEENNPVFIEKATNKVFLKDGTTIDSNSNFIGLPTLLNSTPDNIRKLLAKELASVDAGILSMINDIEYQPSYNSQNKVIDENRFLLSMNDHNLVYITAKNGTLLNKYLHIVAANQITSNGTLYLDGDEERYSFDMFDTTTKKSGEKNEE